MRHSAACSQHSFGVAKRSIDHAHASRIKTCRAPVGKGPFSSSRLRSITLISLHITPYHSISLHITPYHSISLHITPYHSITTYRLHLRNRLLTCSQFATDASHGRRRNARGVRYFVSEQSRIFGVKRLSPGEFVQLM